MDVLKYSEIARLEAAKNANNLRASHFFFTDPKCQLYIVIFLPKVGSL